MPDHAVTLSKVPRLELGKADVEFKVETSGSALGTLKISKGSIVWTPANNKKYRHELSWDEFDALMEHRGHRTSSS